MDIFTQLVIIVGNIAPQRVQMKGSGFLISKNGLISTTRHIIGNDDSNLVILAPHINNINDYQDLADTSCTPIKAKIKEVDPLKDIAIIKADINYDGTIPEIGSFDDNNVGEEVGIFGFPHSVEGRRCLTYQKAEIGAKVILESSGIKSKHAVINIQSRPGQSGSLIFSPRTEKICGMLMGAWIPPGGMGISLGGISPRELHQTTHCISAEYIKEMM